MSNYLIGQSGGPTAVINSSLYGVLKAAGVGSLSSYDTVYGMVNGIEGFMEGNVINLSEHFKTNNIELLKTTPGAFLGSCRCKLPEDLEDPMYEKLFDSFKEMDITTVIYIGGNDSMDTVSKLDRYGKTVSSSIRFIGVPKTIDNDLINTDHTPGYGSAAKYVASTVRSVIWDAGVYRQPVVTILEIMGRHAGWLTAASVLARTEYEPNPMLIYLPEVPFSTEEFISDVRLALTKKSSVVVCISEGIKDNDGTYICEYTAASSVDKFGHKMLAGCGEVLEKLVKNEIGCKCRSIELNLPQRCSEVHASETDIQEAVQAGFCAVEAARKAESGIMISFKRAEGEYHLDYELKDVNEICNKEKKFPLDWIKGGNDISDDFLAYAKPLIKGESKVPYKDGMPELLKPAYIK